MTVLPFEHLAEDPRTPHWIEFEVIGEAGRTWIEDTVRVHLPRPACALERIAALEAAAVRAVLERAGLAEFSGVGLEARVEGWSASVDAAAIPPTVRGLYGAIA